jgi:hypothetical protein
MSNIRSFLKDKTVRKGSPNKKLRANIIKILDDMKESKNDVLVGYKENHNWTLKVVFRNFLYKIIDTIHNINLMYQK